MPTQSASLGSLLLTEQMSSAADTQLPCLDHIWSVVLAGGEGTRIRPAIQDWFGERRPKQYCTFVGTRSLLEHTLSRARRLVPDARTLVVVDKSHANFAEAQLRSRPEIRPIIQPRNCDTAAGVFLPLTYIRRLDPQAIAVLYPSDHFVYPEERFVSTVREAVAGASRLSGYLILLGIEPDCLELDYGWIQPGPAIRGGGGRIRSVRAFVEKPGYSEIRAAAVCGALWNTFVLVVKIESLWRLGWRFFPETMRLFQTLEGAIGSARETEVLDHIYSVMPSFNFSSALLQRIPERVGVLELHNVLWSDWGRPERVVSSLSMIDKTPSFRLRIARPSELRTRAEPERPLAVGTSQ